ncbi:hypothetical protein [Mesorhizobium sp. SP-1A]|uniref:hypothetical protein n=1 Tax=Mesorhizobium sp. SP-1A TaxID=3077840 RepID=UPI0028F7176E|nr:hypothetical protein [Mesorhizobium sp. SP-1A]
MGKALNNHIIDESFAGLMDPKEVHELGREDITSGRPGQSLLQIVQEFGHEGFKQIVETRARERAALAASDAPEAGKKLADFGLNSKSDGPAKDMAISDE